MPLAIIAGMPSGKARKLADVIEQNRSHGHWSLVWLAARKNREDLGTCWDRVEEEAAAASESGAHLLAYHRAVSERGRFEKAIRFRHRLVWLDHSHLYYPSMDDEWWLEIQDRLRLEDAWRRSVRPTNQHHALILPHGRFASQQNPWRTAQRADTERVIARARAELDDFSERHRHRGAWRSEDSLLFHSGGPQHGQAPEDRRWKFTYQLPPGFHFDVRHEDGREFSIVSGDGSSVTYREYTNIDAHGHVRGGR